MQKPQIPQYACQLFVCLFAHAYFNPSPSQLLLNISLFCFFVIKNLGSWVLIVLVILSARSHHLY